MKYLLKSKDSELLYSAAFITITFIHICISLLYNNVSELQVVPDPKTSIYLLTYLYWLDLTKQITTSPSQILILNSNLSKLQLTKQIRRFFITRLTMELFKLINAFKGIQYNMKSKVKSLKTEVIKISSHELMVSNTLFTRNLIPIIITDNIFLLYKNLPFLPCLRACACTHTLWLHLH